MRGPITMNCIVMVSEKSSEDINTFGERLNALIKIIDPLTRPDFRALNDELFSGVSF